ncbi:hypothetical protein LYSBPC_23630 [Lysinibacillus piscis]|uniref:ABC transporter permease n=1 Tax=Lysinibacillus piscis TaxID=2518931 RepID=A0ABQ5NLK3_9BACI|nr:hypothetical protein LYSBPC_23630 [Lysinibacillus sp. KH24]
MLARIINYHFLCIITPKKLLFIIATFITNALLVFSMYSNNSIPQGNIQATIFMFYLPINFKLDLFRCILILLPILIIFGLFMNTEIKERTVYLLLHMKSLSHWFYSLIIVLFIFVFLTFTIGFFTTLGVVTFIPRENVSADWIQLLNYLYTSNYLNLIINQFCLLILSVFLLVLIHLFFIFLIDNLSFTFLLTIMCFILSITIGSIFPNALKWLPLTYGLFAFHELNNYSLIWCYFCILISIVVLIIINFRIVKARREYLFMRHE